jgi:dTDP-glucose 4,6-dehydratase
LKKLNRGEDQINYVKDRPGHDRRYAIDSTKIMTELGWKPEYQFDEGIEHTINWYVKNEQWWRKVMSGEYLKYYEDNYKNKMG